MPARTSDLCVTWLHSRGNDRKCITPWPEGEREKAYMVLQGVPETGLSFVWFEWRRVEFFLKASTGKITVFEAKGVFCALSGRENSLVQTCTLRHYPSICPHNLEICN